MQKGDKVHLRGRKEVTGEIIDTKTERIWGTDYNQYLVKYDNKDLVPQEDWHEDLHLVLVETATTVVPSDSGCQCGVDSVMDKGKHSDYCRLYRRY